MYTPELIRQRRSVRTFDGRELDEGTKAELLTRAESAENPFGIPVSFRFLQGKDHGLVCPVISGCDLYVGGKVEKGESREDALIRECREELGVTVGVKDIFMEVDHVYPDITVHLTLFNATIAEGIPQKLEHNDIKWIKVAEIDDYDFCPADEEILIRLKERL